MIVLDTNVVSEMMRPDPNLAVREWLDAQPADMLFICTPVLAEIRFGIERLADGVHRLRLAAAADKMEAWTFADRILPFDVVAAKVYGRIAAQRQASGRPMGWMDGMIAAIALASHASLASRDRAGFTGIGLDLIDPFVATSC